MFCGAVGVVRRARTAPAASPRRGMLVRHVAGCFCDPEFWGRDCFHRPGCRELESVACVPEMIGAGGWVDGWLSVCRDHSVRIPGFSCVWGKGLLPSSGVPRAREHRELRRDDWCWWVAFGVPRSHGPLRGFDENSRVTPSWSPDFGVGWGGERPHGRGRSLRAGWVGWWLVW
jgi:hypothetical protein